jgi:MYXO-CTERM domain-containing protein
MMAVSRAAHGLDDGPAEVGLTAWTLGWGAIAIVAYVVLRRRRA